MNLSKPCFSIITVAYNASRYIPLTIQSVLAQSCDDYEYLIIDGKSKDNTIEVIEAFHDNRIKIFSEKDNGLYDAMNKGINLASGRFMFFLNAGDLFNSNQVLAKIKTIIESQNPDIIYGETMLIDENLYQLGLRSDRTVQKLPKILNKNSLRYGMVICHQSFFVNKDITPFYIDNNLTADYDWMLKCIDSSKKNINAETIISNYLVGGLSKQKHWQSLRDRFNIMFFHFGLFQTIISHIFIFGRATLFKIARITKD